MLPWSRLTQFPPVSVATMIVPSRIEIDHGPNEGNCCSVAQVRAPSELPTTALLMVSRATS